VGSFKNRAIRVEVNKADRPHIFRGRDIFPDRRKLKSGTWRMTEKNGKTLPRSEESLNLRGHISFPEGLHPPGTGIVRVVEYLRRHERQGKEPGNSDRMGGGGIKKKKKKN